MAVDSLPRRSSYQLPLLLWLSGVVLLLQEQPRDAGWGGHERRIMRAACDLRPENVS